MLTRLMPLREFQRRVLHGAPSIPTLRRWAREQVIPGIQISGRWFVDLEVWDAVSEEAAKRLREKVRGHMQAAPRRAAARARIVRARRMEEAHIEHICNRLDELAETRQSWAVLGWRYDALRPIVAPERSRKQLAAKPDRCVLWPQPVPTRQGRPSRQQLRRMLAELRGDATLPAPKAALFSRRPQAKKNPSGSPQKPPGVLSVLLS